jgi:phospholipid N-methyltransferase
MTVLPPGTLLQLMYIEESLKDITPRHFIEIGPGRGEISNLLLALGWSGTVFELEPTTTALLNERFSSAISEGRYRIINQDWLTCNQFYPCDLIISCMVMEHLDTEQERQFLDKARTSLKPGGLFIALVPGSPAHWGIEDEIAGHFRRYTRKGIRELFANNNWDVLHVSGLTYPISNLLLPLSNWLVRRSESKKLSLSLMERTKQSGIRDVAMKTWFPNVLGILLNKRTLFPLHVLQKLCQKSRNALVLYLEARPTDD